MWSLFLHYIFKFFPYKQNTVPCSFSCFSFFFFFIFYAIIKFLKKVMVFIIQGKKTKGRVKIKMEFIDNKLRRYTTFSKRKTGIMKKVGGLSLAESRILLMEHKYTPPLIFHFCFYLILG